MDQITIRKATSDDLETLYQFEQELINAERPFDTTLKDDTHYYDLAGMIGAPHIQLLVAEVGDKIVGSGYARIEEAKHYLKHTHHAYLGFMYVRPEYRGNGINKMIMEALKDWALSQHITELKLDVYYDNVSAIKAYEKVGFKNYMVSMRLGLDE